MPEASQITTGNIISANLFSKVKDAFAGAFGASRAFAPAMA